MGPLNSGDVSKTHHTLEWNRLSFERTAWVLKAARMLTNVYMYSIRFEGRQSVKILFMGVLQPDFIIGKDFKTPVVWARINKCEDIFLYLNNDLA